MTRATNLTDLQLILLSTAAQRADGGVLPAPASIGDQPDRILGAIPFLLERKLVMESETSLPAAAWRSDGDYHFGLTITSEGNAAIALEEGGPTHAAGDHDAPAIPQSDREESARPARLTKSMQVLDLLRREDGATLPELIAATGWLPHTTRAALTGLRKKGHAINRSKRDDATCYSLAAAA